MSKLPKNAKKVFEGILFDIYQWKQEMFDGSYQIFEKIVRMPSSQLIVITKEEKLILLNEEQPSIGKFTGLVGGHVEKNETPIQNAKKELLEETGMKTDNIKLWKITNLGSKIEWESHYFIAKNCEKIQDPTPEVGEKIEVREFNFDNFIKETQKENFRNKNFQNMIFKMIHTKGELDKFKKLILNN